LEDWGRATPDDRERQQLMELIQAAEPRDTFRARWRAAVTRRDTDELRKLVKESAVESLPPSAVCNLAEDLKNLKESPAAERLLRTAQERKPADFWLNHDLGVLLREQVPTRAQEAVGYLRAALALRSDSPGVYFNLGNALRDKGDLEGAVRCYETAVRIDGNYALAHYLLGRALMRTGRLDKAIDAYNEAIRLKPDLELAHISLGIALGTKGHLDEGIAAFHEAIRLKPGSVEAHLNLGYALQMKGRLDEALAAYSKATRLEPNNAESNASLGRVRELIELDNLLAKVLSGERQPANAAERAKLAYLCAQPYKQLMATAARFYAEALAAEPKLAEDLMAQHRYNAACVAVLAAAGQGQDTQKLDPSARAGFRQQALDWLRADLTFWNKHLENGSPQFRTALQATLEHWRLDSDLASIRGETALAQLAADEQPGWRRLWVDVDNTLAKARGSTMTEKK